MSIDKRILRINELAKKAKTIGLTDEEKEEQKTLRLEYVKGFKQSLEQTLENTVLMDEDGNKTPLKKKEN